MKTATRWETIQEWPVPAGDPSTYEVSRELLAGGESGVRGAPGEQPRQVMVSEKSPRPYHPHIKTKSGKIVPRSRSDGLC